MFLMIPWDCRHVSQAQLSLWRGSGSSLLILESCEEAGECYRVWFNQTELGERGGITPPPVAWGSVNTFQVNICGVGTEEERHRMKERGGESGKSREKNAPRYMVAWPEESVFLPREGGCACVLVWIVWLVWLFVASICQDYHSPTDVCVYVNPLIYVFVCWGIYCVYSLLWSAHHTWFICMCKVCNQPCS